MNSHVPLAAYCECESKYGTYLVIWYGEVARSPGKRMSGTFSSWPHRALATYVVFGSGSVLYEPVRFGSTVYPVGLRAVFWRALPTFGPGPPEAVTMPSDSRFFTCSPL